MPCNLFYKFVSWKEMLCNYLSGCIYQDVLWLTNHLLAYCACGPCKDRSFDNSKLFPYFILQYLDEFRCLLRHRQSGQHSTIINIQSRIMEKSLDRLGNQVRHSLYKHLDINSSPNNKRVIPPKSPLRTLPNPTMHSSE